MVTGTPAQAASEKHIACRGEAKRSEGRRGVVEAGRRRRDDGLEGQGERERERGRENSAKRWVGKYVDAQRSDVLRMNLLKLLRSGQRNMFLEIVHRRMGNSTICMNIIRTSSRCDENVPGVTY